MAEHSLKTLTEYFNLQAEGLKPFEIRLNDRDYQVGDVLELLDYGDWGYTGGVLRVEVTCVVDYMQQPGYVVMGTKILPWDGE